MDLVPFDPGSDPEKLRACYELEQAARQADQPEGPPQSLPMFAGAQTHPSPYSARECWLAAGDTPGTWVGSCRLQLPSAENPHLTSVSLLVHPAHRRAGLGRELLAHAIGRARAHGRTLLRSDALVGGPGDAFAAATGAARGMEDVRRVQDLRDVPAGQLTALRRAADSAAAGYSLTSWTGAAPGEHIGQVARVSAAMQDAPHNPGSEVPSWDIARIRDEEAMEAAQKVNSYSVAAFCDRTGELAALSVLSVDPESPEWGRQDLTAVLREHRGHRLGLLVKLAMLELLAEREPAVRKISTYNAAGNPHMIAINEQLGYRVLDRWQTWQLGLAAA